MFWYPNKINKIMCNELGWWVGIGNFWDAPTPFFLLNSSWKILKWKCEKEKCEIPRIWENLPPQPGQRTRTQARIISPAGWTRMGISGSLRGSDWSSCKGIFKLINYRINGVPRELKAEVVVLHGQFLIPNPDQKWDWSSSGTPKVKAQLCPTKA